jgi:hypothetical protein
MDWGKRCFPAPNHNYHCREIVFLPVLEGGVLGIAGFGGNYSASDGFEFAGEMADCFRVRTLGPFACPVLFDLLITIGRISRMMPR